MAGYYLNEDGGYFQLEDGSGFLVLDGEGTAERPAGRRRRFTNYVLRVDGEEFPCHSLEDALVTLERAKALARKISQERVRAATEPRASVKPLPVPEITANSRDLKPAVREAQDKIKAIYRQANMDIEIALWFAAEREREKDDDEIAVLFLM